jgi:hypothetical protein
MGDDSLITLAACNLESLMTLTACNQDSLIALAVCNPDSLTRTADDLGSLIILIA